MKAILIGILAAWAVVAIVLIVAVAYALVAETWGETPAWFGLAALLVTAAGAFVGWVERDR